MSRACARAGHTHGVAQGGRKAVWGVGGGALWLAGGIAVVFSATACQKNTNLCEAPADLVNMCPAEMIENCTRVVVNAQLDDFCNVGSVECRGVGCVPSACSAGQSQATTFEATDQDPEGGVVTLRCSAAPASTRAACPAPTCGPEQACGVSVSVDESGQVCDEVSCGNCPEGAQCVGGQCVPVGDAPAAADGQGTGDAGTMPDAIACPPGTPCCNPDGTYVPEGTTGAQCSGPCLRCDGFGHCVPHDDLCDDSIGCTADYCDDATGACLADLSACPCKADADCPASTPCVDIYCDDAHSCAKDVHTGQACDDGDPCTIGDACAEDGVCGGVPKDCDDGLACTMDTCCTDAADCPDAQPGDCIHPVAVAKDNCCATAGDCDDSDPCTADLCTAESSCIHAAIPGCCHDDAQCDDGVACTEDSCAAGACAHTPVPCPDGGPCMVGACDPASGHCTVQEAPYGTPCDDGDDCTLGDACQGGACTPGAPTPCDDGNACTNDSCDAGQCVHTPNGDPCDDGDPCTIHDGCAGGACTGEPKDCSSLATDACHVGVCSAGACVLQQQSGPCDDGDPCTENDACSGGTCTGKPKCPGACDQGTCVSALCAFRFLVLYAPDPPGSPPAPPLVPAILAKSIDEIYGTGCATLEQVLATAAPADYASLVQGYDVVVFLGNACAWAATPTDLGPCSDTAQCHNDALAADWWGMLSGTCGLSGATCAQPTAVDKTTASACVAHPGGCAYLVSAVTSDGLLAAVADFSSQIEAKKDAPCQ